MSVVLMALGLVLILEGLVFALAPSRIEDLLDTIRRMPVEARRLIGLLALVAGVILIAVARIVAA